MKKVVVSASAEETEVLGEKIGRQLKGGEVIELSSDLGGGKTTFTRGLAKGAGSIDHVASPTFTIKREYAANALTLHHFDFYRLNEPGVMADELGELLHDAGAVIIIEWSTVVQNILPEARLRIELTNTEAGGRHITITCPDRLSYLLHW